MLVTARGMLTHYAVLRWQVLEPLLGERTKECGPPNKGAKGARSLPNWAQSHLGRLLDLTLDILQQGLSASEASQAAR